jgi:hypothetical protein
MSIAEDLDAQLELYYAALHEFTLLSASHLSSLFDFSMKSLRQMSAGESNGSDNL